MKQLALAGMMYSQDYDETMPGYNIDSAGKEISWGKYYWMFQFQPYIKGYAANWDKPRTGVFFCPSDPAEKPQYLSETRADQVLPEPAGTWGLSLTKDLDGKRALGYWCSYSINEHITDWEDRGRYKGGPQLSNWKNPAESFFLLEAWDSEIEGDEMDESYGVPASERSAVNKVRGEGGHGKGMNIAYLDGHVKWSKLTYKNNNSALWSNWVFPPTSKAGEECDYGQWTAPDDDTLANQPATDSGGKACK